MTVKAILEGKDSLVVTAEPKQSLRDIVSALAERRIGAIIVSNPEREVLGIISERDIVRALARNGAAALDDQVLTHMTAKVVTCAEDTTISAVMELMSQGRFRHMPVVKGGTLIGVISIGDVVKRRLAEMEHEQAALRTYIATA